MSIYRQRPRYSTRPTLFRQLGTLLLIFLFLAGLAAALFLFFFRGYVVSTPSGPRLQIPLFLPATSQTTGAEGEPAHAVFGNDQTVSLPEQASLPALLAPLHAVQLPEESIVKGTAEKDMKQIGANAVIFDMRGEDGALHYISNLKTAIASGASAASPGLNEAIQAMNRNPNLYSIALVSCFSDSYAGKLYPELCLKRDAGVPWRDENNMTWLSPAKDAVQTYLWDICRELSCLGFDEILLTNCSYPTNGARAQQFEGGNRVETLSLSLQNFYQEARRVLKEKGVALSLLWEDAPKNDKQEPLSGQSLADILPLADRIFLMGDENQVAEVFSSRGLSCANLSLVPILPEPGVSSRSWAVLSSIPKK